MARSDFGFQIGSALATKYLTDSTFVKGTYLVVASIAERDALPVDTGNGGIIIKGSLVYVQATEKYYIYNGSAWQEAEFGGGDVTDVKVDGTSVVTNKVANIDLATPLALKEDVANKVTVLGNGATDTQYPSAKVVYDTTEDIREIAAGKNKNYVSSIAKTPALNSQNDLVEVTQFVTTDDEVVTPSQVHKGDNVYVTDTDVPDRWVSGIRVESGGGGRLPSEYQEVQYIQSDGNQYIDTGYTLSLNTKVQTKFKNLYATGEAIFGVGGEKYRLFNFVNKVYWDYDRSSRIIGPENSCSPDTLYEFEFGNNYVKDIPTETIIVTGDECTTLLSGTIKLNYYGATLLSKNSWYYFKIYDSDVLVRDLVPCYRKVDSKPGMYDLVTDTFYTNANGSATTDFEVGPDANSPSNDTNDTYYIQLSKLETAKVPVTDVKIDTTSIVSNTVATIPYATNTTAGVSKTSPNDGISIGANHQLMINLAGDAAIESKTNRCLPIVPANLDKAVKEGLGNYNLGANGANAWSAEYKSHAREVIGANAVSVSANGSSTTKAKYITVDGTEYKIGGGDVTDVLVDGTSVVDANGAAQVNLTGKQDVLTSDNAGTNVTITTGGTTHSLPEGYTELAYIGCNGYQWIDTGVLTNNITRIVFEGQCNENGSRDKQFLGTNSASTTSFIGTNDGSGWKMQTTPKVAGMQTIVADITLNGASSSGTVSYGGFTLSFISIASFTGFNPDVNLLLLGGNADRASTDSRCQFLKLYNGDTLLFEGYAAKRNSDDVLGMYDKVTSTFFTNAGTREFVNGGAIEGGLKINALPGLTATVQELNVLDGITATTLELNYTSGVTSNIQTQLNSKQPNLPQTVNDKYLHTNASTGALEWSDLLVQHTAFGVINTNAVDTSYTYNHGLNTMDLVVQVTDSNKETILVDVDRTSTNIVTIEFGSAPGVDTFNVYCIAQSATSIPSAEEVEY